MSLHAGFVVNKIQRGTQVRIDSALSFLCRGELNGMHVLLSRSQEGPGRAVKQEQEENSRNHVKSF